MPFDRSRWLVLCVCTAFLTGCGSRGNMTGGGGGSGSNPAVITIHFDGSATPTVVAAKMGSGAYSAQSLTNGTLTLSVPDGTSNYAVAYLCPSVTGSNEVEEDVWEASTADGSSVSFVCPTLPNQAPNLTGALDASAIAGVQEFEIDSQQGDASDGSGLSAGAASTFNVPALIGTDRVLALAYANGTQSPVAAMNFENQTVPGALNGGNTVVFGTADETSSEAITYNNVPSGFAAPTTLVDLEMGGTSLDTYATKETTQYRALPAGATEKGDVYLLLANASNTSGSSVSAQTLTSGGPVSFSFPAPFSYAGPQAAALPSFTLNYTGFSSGNILHIASIAWDASTQNSSGGSHSTNTIQVTSTASYQNGSASVSIPDLSGVSGFLASPASGVQVTWTASVAQQSWSVTGSMPVGGSLSEAEASGQYTVP